MNRIPKRFHVGGQDMEVKSVERGDNNCLGHSRVAQGIIEIAEKYDRNETVSDGNKLNTFYHELTHAILYTMGEVELNDNEKFVCSFSGFLTEAIRSFEYE